MPKQRLRWNYLRRLVRGYTASHVLLDAYTEHSMSLRASRQLVSGAWWYELAIICINPNYLEEISRQLRAFGLHSHLMSA